MVWIFGGLLAAGLIFFLISRSWRHTYPADLSRKEHPLKALYPMAAHMLHLLKPLLSKGDPQTVNKLLRSIYVKENVETESTFYHLKKTAVCIAVTGMLLLIGLFTALSEEKSAHIETLSRADPGEGMTHYELAYKYQGEEDELDMDLEAQALTQSQIRERFEESLEEVRRIMLGSNASADQVTEPLHLLSEYNGFSVYWEIEDISAINYNGEILIQPEEEEGRVVYLYATFSMDGVSETYPIPVRLTLKDADAREVLQKSIRDAVAANNDIYRKEVTLPRQIDGYALQFYEKQEHNAWMFLILAVLAAAAVFLLYDRRLREQVRSRQEQMMLDFSEIVSKLNLLYEAGLSIHGAFQRIAEEQKDLSRYAYQELRLVLEKIESGVGEAHAYAEFGKRCGLYSYIKLGNLLEQNLSKGTKGMKVLLQQEAAASQEERKRMARKKGEEASTKILLPMVLLLLVVIAIIAVPALMSMHV